MKQIQLRGQSLQRLYARHFHARRRSVEKRVEAILDEVRIAGDAALVKYTRRFDKARLSPRTLRVAEAEISGAFQNITGEFIAHLKTIIHNVTLFYKKQRQRPAFVRHEDGVVLREAIHPLESVGVYIPAGTAPLVSTVYMTVIPAQVAGVKRVVIVTPPDEQGRVNPYILAVANLLKVNEIYKVGGAQAVAALAFGTRSVPRVDKIVGPGNMYVTEAKRQLYGYVDIDMLAGPSELVVIANRFSPVDFVVADMEAQMEHLDGLSILVTTSRTLLKTARRRLTGGYGILVRNMDEAVDVVNRIAPEHLEIMTNEPMKIAKRIRHAGAIFLGPYSPTALGDYAAGPSHVLPTMGTARFFSGLSLVDFQKRSHLISYSRKALDRLRTPIEQVALMEGLSKHAESIHVRFHGHDQRKDAV